MTRQRFRSFQQSTQTTTNQQERDANLTNTALIDITMSLTVGEYKPNINQTTHPLYIKNETTNYQTSLKRSPKTLTNKLSTHLYNEPTSNQEALSTSGYTHIIKYKPT